jgi:hypothetical protein
MIKKYGNMLVWILMEYTLAAIAVWGLSFLVNRWVKNEKNKEEE